MRAVRYPNGDPTKKKLMVQLPKMRAPFGLSEFTDQNSGKSSYSVDLSSSYSLTRNLEVTAGVRYRSDRERIARVEDDRRDSQAAYIGTAFRF